MMEILTQWGNDRDRDTCWIMHTVQGWKEWEEEWKRKMVYNSYPCVSMWGYVTQVLGTTPLRTIDGHDNNTAMLDLGQGSFHPRNPIVDTYAFTIRSPEGTEPTRNSQIQ